MPARKRKRRPGGAAGGATQTALVDRQGRPLPVWRWRTMPVYFGLSLGLFAGFNLGLLATREWPRLETIGSFAFAVMFSFALAQVVTRTTAAWVLRRQAGRGDAPHQETTQR